MSTHAILYRSLATAPMGDLELQALAVRAAQRNAHQRITGLLLHGTHQYVPGAPGAFVQWIEGPQDAVRELFETIREDSRHTDIEILVEGPVAQIVRDTERMFPDWDLQVESIVDLPATLPGFLAYVEGRRTEGEGRWAVAA